MDCATSRAQSHSHICPLGHVLFKLGNRFMHTCHVSLSLSFTRCKMTQGKEDFPATFEKRRSLSLSTTVLSLLPQWLPAMVGVGSSGTGAG